MSKHKPRRDIDKAIANVIKYVEKPPWGQRFDEFYGETLSLSAEELGVSADALASSLEEAEYQAMVFGYLFEDFAGCHWKNEQVSFIDDYLKRRGWREAAIARRYLQAMNDTQADLWEIVAVAPGQYADVQPYGENLAAPLRVYEKSATQSLNQNDCVAGKVILLDGKHMFTGGILPFPSEVAATVQDLIDKTIAENVDSAKQYYAEEKTPEPADLEEVEIAAVESHRSTMLVRVWLAYTYRALNSPMPTLVNKEGDIFQFSTVRFPFDSKHHDQIVACLHSTPDLDYIEQNNEWVWLPCAADDMPDTGVSILGHVEVSENAVDFKANSTKRAQNGEAYFKNLLKGLVRQPLTLHESVESSLERHSKNPTQPAIDAPELIELKQRLMGQHYRNILDDPIPMLGGKTPRECAKDPQSREQVTRWLKSLEKRSAPQDVTSELDYDFEWMWKELELTR